MLDATRYLILRRALPWTLLVLLAAADSRAEVAFAKRWAIVCSAELREAGLSDLLTARLTAGDTLQVVEREALDRLAKEIQLSAIAESAAAGARLRLGRLLSADALLLVSVDRRGPTPTLRIVISECRYGTRLFVDQQPYAADDLAAIGDRCADQVRRTRRQFAGGIDYVVGIGGFVNESLTHDHDHLQGGFAYLLQRALLDRPGVAVIETQEAPAIQQELALAAKVKPNRLVLVKVDGQFTVERSSAADAARVQFVIRTSTSGQPLPEFRTQPMKLADVPKFLMDDLPIRLLGDAASRQPAAAFGGVEQIEWLASRATTFAQLGDWQHAVGLREAAILLAPRNVELRRAILGEYRRILTRSLGADLKADDRQPRNPRAVAAIRRRVDAFIAYLGHLEFLVRNRLITANEAVEKTLTTRALLTGIPFQSWIIDGQYWRLGQEELERAEKALRQYIHSTHRLVLELPRAKEPSHEFAEFQFLNIWQTPLLQAVVFRVDRMHRSRADLDELYHTLTEEVPDRIAADFHLTQMLKHTVRYHAFGSPERSKYGDDAITPKDWVAFLKKLTAADHRMASMYGRYGLLQLRFQQRRRTAQQSRELLDEATKLLDDYAALGYCVPANDDRRREWLYSQLSFARTLAARELNPAGKSNSRPSQPPPANVGESPPAGWHKDPRLWNTFGVPPQHGRFEVVPVRVQLKCIGGETAVLDDQRWRAPGGWGPANRHTRCGDHFDVRWNSGVVLVMRDRDLFEEAIVDDQAHIVDVQWDGTHVWIATRNAGIWLLDPSTLEIVARCDRDQGLPPADRGVMLLPISAGKVCAVGSFGEHDRAWCAIVEFNDDRFSVNVFHEATHVPTTSYRDDRGDDPQLVFKPHWVHDYQGVSPDARQMLVGRHAPSAGGRRKPLLIDLDSLEVSVFQRPLSMADHYFSHSYLSAGGDLLECSGFQVAHYAAPGRTHAEGEDSRRLCTESSNRGVLSKHLLVFGGKVYAPGYIWFRIGAGWQDETLFVPQAFPQMSSMRNYGVSAYYGPIGWDATTFSRFVLHEPAAEADQKGTQ